uniref:Hypotheticial protein n=1 Tax=Schistosoma japonicum TaxID=6182 RepID=C1LHF2_SCHJA|nr:hypotheticial protein [Schistosoma japonicum]CAX74131.1 hypotheticial protein [Schistosoma japonicum]
MPCRLPSLIISIRNVNVPRVRLLNTFSLFLNVHLAIKRNFRGLVRETNRLNTRIVNLCFM